MKNLVLLPGQGFITSQNFTKFFSKENEQDVKKILGNFGVGETWGDWSSNVFVSVLHVFKNVQFIKSISDRNHDVYGYSIAHLCALYFKGILSEYSLYNFIISRALLMDSHKRNGYGLIGVVGLERRQIELILEEYDDNEVALSNYNSKLNSSVAIRLEVYDRLTESLLSKGAKKVVQLDAPGPWHSRFMSPVLEDFKVLVDSLQLIPQHNYGGIFSNVTGNNLEYNEIKKDLVSQMCLPVDFQAFAKLYFSGELVSIFETNGSLQLRSFLFYDSYIKKL